VAGKVAAADNPDVYQVIVHVGTGALAVPARPPGSRPAFPRKRRRLPSTESTTEPVVRPG
jgi:hypothetical protein